MPIVCGVKFKGTCKVYHFALRDGTDLLVDDYVIVETARGKEMGQVAIGAHEIDKDGVIGNLKPVLRMASPAELLSAERYRLQEESAAATCREHVARFGLPMKIVSAEYNYDGTRLTFFFTSEQRVDFRELVRDLARVFRTRIELRQIGIRDEAKIVGGIGKCGRALCCSTWLTDFSPVSIRMAKQQNLPLSPMEISGLCGRLLCCLRYENDFYQEAKKQYPKQGKTVDTPFGRCKILKVNVLRETLTLLPTEGPPFEVSASEFRGEDPPSKAAAPDILGDVQRRNLDTILPTLSPKSKPTNNAGNESSSALSRRSSSRRRRKPSSATMGQSNQGGETSPDAGGQEQKAEGSPSQGSNKSRSSRRRRRSRSKAQKAGQSGNTSDPQVNTGTSSGNNSTSPQRRTRLRSLLATKGMCW